METAALNGTPFSVSDIFVWDKELGQVSVRWEKAKKGGGGARGEKGDGEEEEEKERKLHFLTARGMYH